MYGKLINEMKELPLIVAQTKVGKTVEVKVLEKRKRNNKKNYTWKIRNI
jgi:hypothetical protein